MVFEKISSGSKNESQFGFKVFFTQTKFDGSSSVGEFLNSWRNPKIIKGVVSVLLFLQTQDLVLISMFWF